MLGKQSTSGLGLQTFFFLNFEAKSHQVAQVWLWIRFTDPLISASLVAVIIGLNYHALCMARASEPWLLFILAYEFIPGGRRVCFYFPTSE